MIVEGQVDKAVALQLRAPNDTYLVECWMRLFAIEINSIARQGCIVFRSTLSNYASRDRYLALAEETYTCRVGRNRRDVGA